jgi:hypothetical protein
MRVTLLATSHSLDGIASLIARFYGGERKALRPDGSEWRINGARGEIPGVRIVQRRGLYCFIREAN